MPIKADKGPRALDLCTLYGEILFQKDFRKTQTVGNMMSWLSASVRQQLGQTEGFIWEETEGLLAGAVVPVVHWPSDTFYT